MRGEPRPVLPPRLRHGVAPPREKGREPVKAHPGVLPRVEQERLEEPAQHVVPPVAPEQE